MKRAAAVLIALAALVVATIVVKPGRSGEAGRGDTVEASSQERGRVQRFWEAYRRATALRIAGQLQEAADAYTEALVLEPEHHNTLYYLGNVEVALGNLAAAEDAWRRLAEVDPTSARAHSQLGTLYFCTGGVESLQPQRAIVEFERAAAINREETGPLLSLGEIALVRGELSEAQDYFAAVTGSNFSSVPAHFYDGYIAWKSGSPDRAAQLLDTAAAYARPAPAENPASGEIDTAPDDTTATAQTAATCGILRERATELARSDEAVNGDEEAVYGAFDELLRRVRKKLPS